MSECVAKIDSSQWIEKISLKKTFIDQIDWQKDMHKIFHFELKNYQYIFESKIWNAFKSKMISVSRKIRFHTN